MGRQRCAKDGGVGGADGHVLAVVNQGLALGRAHRVAKHLIEVFVAGVLGAEAQSHAHGLAYRLGDVVADGAPTAQLRGHEECDVLPVALAEREPARAQRLQAGHGNVLDVLGEQALGGEVAIAGSVDDAVVVALGEDVADRHGTTCVAGPPVEHDGLPHLPVRRAKPFWYSCGTMWCLRGSDICDSQ